MAVLNFWIQIRLSVLEHAYIVYGRCGVYNSMASHLAKQNDIFYKIIQSDDSSDFMLEPLQSII
jgi:hypothetical protein